MWVSTHWLEVLFSLFHSVSLRVWELASNVFPIHPYSVPSKPMSQHEPSIHRDNDMGALLVNPHKIHVKLLLSWAIFSPFGLRCDATSNASYIENAVGLLHWPRHKTMPNTVPHWWCALFKHIFVWVFVCVLCASRASVCLASVFVNLIVQTHNK